MRAAAAGWALMGAAAAYEAPPVGAGAVFLETFQSGLVRASARARTRAARPSSPCAVWARASREATATRRLSASREATAT